MRLIKIIFLSLFIQFVGERGFTQDQPVGKSEISIQNFLVKEYPNNNDQLVLIAADLNDKPMNNLHGTFIFSINGFQQEFRFEDGQSVITQPIKQSTFIYIKHQNDSGNPSKLFYVIKKFDRLNPIKISWLLLVLIPLMIILFAIMFRKFIVIAGILLIALFYYNNSKGLRISTFFDTIFDGLKNLINLGSI